MRMLLNVYGLYDNGELIFKGNRMQVEKQFNVNRNCIFSYLRKGLKINGKYDIKKVGQDYFDVECKRKKKERQRKRSEAWSLEDRYDYLEWHLKYCGNTICQFDPYPYLERLEEAGLKTNVKQILDENPPIETNKRGRRPKPKYHYYLEVAHV